MMKANKNESGYTLVGVLAVFTISSIIVLSLVMISFNSLKASKIEVNNQAVFYIAEAGLNKAVNELENKINDLEGHNDEASFNNALSGLFNDVKAKADELAFEKIKHVENAPSVELDIKKTNNGNENEYVISSTGHIDNHKRTVERAVTIAFTPGEEGGGNEGGGTGKWSPFKDYGVYSFGDMVLDRGQYHKEIGTGSKEVGSINLKNFVQIFKDATIPKNNNNIISGSGLFGNIKIEEPLETPQLPYFKDIDNVDVVNLNRCPSDINRLINNNEIYLSSLDLTNCTLNFNHYENEVNVYVKGNVIFNNTKIKIDNSPVNLFVEKNVTIPAGSTGSEIHSSIYAKGNIIINKGSSGNLFFGNLFSDSNIEIKGINNPHTEIPTSAGSFYSELIYSKNSISFNDAGSVLYGTSVISDNVDLYNVTAHEDIHLPSSFSNSSLSLDELDKRPSDEDNEGPEGGSGNGGSNGEIKFNPGPLHEIDNKKKDKN